MNPRRGHESSAHLQAKMDVGQIFDASGWSVFYEQRNADVLVLHNATRFVAAIEVESSPRNVMRNLKRNLAFGCKAIAVVVLKERYFAQIASMVLDLLQTRPGKSIKVFVYNAQGLNKLHGWLTALIRSEQEETENPS